MWHRREDELNFRDYVRFQANTLKKYGNSFITPSIGG